MQSKLPDLNNYWKQYHEEGKSALQKYDYEGCVNAVDCMNALMPDEYRLEISTAKYEELLKNNDLVCCIKCKKEYDWNIIKVMNLLLSQIESILEKSKTYKAWICLECKYENKVSESKLIKPIIKEPFYLKVIPKAPKVPAGLERRTGFNTKMSNWWHNAKVEIDHQLALIRQEYSPDEEDPDSEDGGEE